MPLSSGENLVDPLMREAEHLRGLTLSEARPCQRPCGALQCRTLAFSRRFRVTLGCFSFALCRVDLGGQLSREMDLQCHLDLRNPRVGEVKLKRDQFTSGRLNLIQPAGLRMAPGHAGHLDGPPLAPALDDHPVWTGHLHHPPPNSL